MCTLAENHRVTSTQAPSGTIAAIDVELKTMQVRVRYRDGRADELSFDQANKIIKVNGVPIIDWYARKN